MCGITGIYDMNGNKVQNLGKKVEVMNKLQNHRGPDDEGIWLNSNSSCGFGHKRLSIIDLTSGKQPMIDDNGNVIVFNGEIYNYLELKQELSEYKFKTTSDTEVILKAYEKWGYDCVDHLRGMFAFAIWDEKDGSLFCSRDRFGIKPFYYFLDGERIFFASEIKSMLPFVESIETNIEAFKEYLTFQLCLGEKTLFKNIFQLNPGHSLIIRDGSLKTYKYWEVYYDLDFDHTEKYFIEHLRELVLDSIEKHLLSDVKVGGYVSGGLDSGIVSSVAADYNSEYAGFVGKFDLGETFDESKYAVDISEYKNFPLYQLNINHEDFIDNIQKIIYHMDYPEAGPGLFAQYMVSELAAKHRKVVLGGQGGDEIFGGYTRYLIAYFEQCIKAAIDGTMNNGNFIVTYESIIPNLASLRKYKPLLKQFWSNGLFEDVDKRYFTLINRAPRLGEEINWEYIKDYSPYETFRDIFYAPNVKKESYFDSMTHFDFKTLLPALLHVEDRMSMAHGLESRVPFLDHPLIEFSATIPSNVKFKDGELKYSLKKALGNVLPGNVLNRKDKMGFPVPLNIWLKDELNSFVKDIFSTQKARSRTLINNQLVLEKIETEHSFGRNIWGLLCMEIWQSEFHDKESYYKNLV